MNARKLIVAGVLLLGATLGTTLGMTTATWAQVYYTPYGYTYYGYGPYHGYGPYYRGPNYYNYYNHPRGGPGGLGIGLQR
jgi:hypothetical protein